VKRFSVRQQDGRIAIAYKSLVKIEANQDATPSLVWNVPLAISSGIDPNTTQDEFQASRIREENVQWSSVQLPSHPLENVTPSWSLCTTLPP